MRLVLVRHGESTWNVEGRYQGRLDVPLSPRGRAQAGALATRLMREQLDSPIEQHLAAIVSSPLARACDTARICGQALGLPVSTDERLTEISHGEWEGKLRGEVASRWPEMLATWRTRPHLVQFPRGETLDDVRLRFESFLRGLPDVSSILATTHDVIVRIAMLQAEAKPLSSFTQVHVDNAALNEFRWEDGTLTAVRLNDMAHLGSLRSDTLSQAL